MQGVHFQRQGVHFQMQGLHFQMQDILFQMQGIYFQTQGIHFRTQGIHFQIVCAESSFQLKKEWKLVVIADPSDFQNFRAVPYQWHDLWKMPSGLGWAGGAWGWLGLGLAGGSGDWFNILCCMGQTYSGCICCLPRPSVAPWLRRKIKTAIAKLRRGLGCRSNNIFHWH